MSEPAEPAPTDAFALSEDLRRAELSRSQRDAWARQYKKGGRQIRRWWDEGAPLHDPPAMARWWENERAAGRKKWGVPDGILSAAAAHAATAPAPAADPALGDRAADPASPAATSGAVAPRPGDPNKSIDLADYDDAEGDILRDLKTLHAARKAELSRALKAGIDANLLQSNYLKLTEQIDKMKSRIVERLKKEGLFIFRPDVERDLAKAAELMRQMTESESRRVLELCPALSVAAREQVSAAVIRVGTARARALRNLASLKSTADAVLEFAAA